MESAQLELKVGCFFFFKTKNNIQNNEAMSLHLQKLFLLDVQIGCDVKFFKCEDVFLLLTDSELKSRLYHHPWKQCVDN